MNSSAAARQSQIIQLYSTYADWIQLTTATDPSSQVLEQQVLMTASLVAVAASLDCPSTTAWLSQKIDVQSTATMTSSTGLLSYRQFLVHREMDP